MYGALPTARAAIAYNHAMDLISFALKDLDTWRCSIFENHDRFRDASGKGKGLQRCHWRAHF
jgi:hypothetical protein